MCLCSMNDHLAMASMATKGAAGLYCPGNLHKVEKKNNVTVLAMAKAGFPCSWHMITPKKRSFYAIASAGNPPSLDITNGKKVNGNHVRETPSPYISNTNAGGLAIHSNVAEPHTYLLGRFVEDRLIYRQTFSIRSYEIGPDKTATMETLMNLLQETALNHVTSSGLAGNGFGATREMSLRKLIWVVTRIHVQVQRYSCWGDVVEIDTWVDATGKNGMRRDWIIRDYNTKEIITRATSTWVIMNRETRKLSKIPDEVREELVPFYINRLSIAAEHNDVEKIDKLNNETAGRIRSGLAPRWSDMDANQHINNVKYIGWILESVPMHVLEHYNMTGMTLEYRRECRQSNLLESLTSTSEDSNSGSSNRKAGMEYTHLLRMQADKAEIVRARTEWKSKLKHK
ncbi:palmitoyl-acyl carrier protein thioesterase, chloroplastic-like [Populus nigra]|uniref:palmitoyl-acyl carrier protein thioesterase, chloroplastic-like n=1 Tax=Populus nigra TaxID=3691 RepID=UPI002B27B814|nr:palmitoyl-acyl carrier protein thioesterase, chloroplastic-like [Populus nigra]